MWFSRKVASIERWKALMAWIPEICWTLWLPPAGANLSDHSLDV